MKYLKNLSIRSRVAYGILCLEKILNFYHVDIEKWNLLLNELWKYTNSNVGKWHEYISEMTPFSILEKVEFKLKECEYIDQVVHNELLNLYENVDLDVLKIIDLIFEIGTRDLYTSISNNSPDTIKYINEIEEILISKNILLPTTQNLEKFDITQNYGWGNEFTRNQIIVRNGL